MTTRKLTDAQEKRLLRVLNNIHWPNQVRFEENDTYITKGGNLGCVKYDRRPYEALFDQGLLEAQRVEGYCFAGDYPAAGIYWVTEKGKEALKTGRYKPVVAKRVSQRPADFVSNRNPFNDLPRIVMVHGVSDGGEGAFCPHCGADGRWIIQFVCEGGIHASAMRGCFKLWPKSKFAELAARLLGKEREYAERSKKTGREWKLCSWDVEMLQAIEAFCDGTMTEQEAWAAISAAQARAETHRKRRGWNRAPYS